MFSFVRVWSSGVDGGRPTRSDTISGLTFYKTGLWKANYFLTNYWSVKVVDLKLEDALLLWFYEGHSNNTRNFSIFYWFLFTMNLFFNITSVTVDALPQAVLSSICTIFEKFCTLISNPSFCCVFCFINAIETDFFRCSLSFGNRKKSDGARSGL